VLRELLADPSPAGIAAALDAWCRQALGAGIAASELFYASVGSVHGLRLDDGRRVVVKLHRPGTSARFIRCVQTVQRRLADDGFPAPEPLAGPAPFGSGIASAEALLDDGEHTDAHDPAVRQAMAAALARLVALCRPLTSLDGLRENPMTRAADRLWPTPHEGRFNFEATAVGAEWLDRLATRARVICDRDVGDLVVGHTDWRAQHLRFSAGRLTAAYDWDSLSIVREPQLVGIVAHGFTADWERAGGGPQLPSLEEALAFASEYADARGAPFTAEEDAVLRASLAYTMAYTARCEHSDALTDMGRRPAEPGAVAAPARSARAFLAAHAEELLAG
jgi:hypothetical protein